ncbi:MAG: hypothetical protein AAFX87_04000 [Bacteroidota bacterium]
MQGVTVDFFYIDNMKSKRKMTLVAVFVLFFMLLNTPFLSIPDGMIGGLPALMLYIGACWVILIAVMAYFFTNRNRHKN